MNWEEHIGKLLDRGTQDSLCGQGTPLLLPWESCLKLVSQEQEKKYQEGFPDTTA